MRLQWIILHKTQLKGEIKMSDIKSSSGNCIVPKPNFDSSSDLGAGIVPPNGGIATAIEWSPNPNSIVSSSTKTPLKVNE